MTKKNFKLFSIIAITLILLMAVVAAGCTTQTNTPTATATPLPTTKNVTDDYGRIVTMPYNITRVSSPYPQFDLTMDMLGVGKTDIASRDIIVSNPTLTTFNPALANVSTPWANGGLNAEQLMAAQPQVVFITSYNKNLQALLDTGLPVVVMNFTTNDDYLKAVALMGDVYGGNAQKIAGDYISYVNGEQANITSRVANIPASQRQVFLQTAYHSDMGWFSEGPTDNLETLLTKCGGISAFQGYNVSGGYVTEEQILVYAKNATIIFTYDNATLNQIKNDSAWQNVPAVKNNQIYVYPTGIMSWTYSAPEYEALLPIWATKTMYPDQFKDVDFAGRMKYFYPTFMHYNISDREVSAFMNNLTANPDQGITLNPSEVIPQ
jgi:iron complex transport system substrate-binding protein